MLSPLSRRQITGTHVFLEYLQITVSDLRYVFLSTKRYPFQQTRLGKSPGEIRELIYENVSIAPASQQPYTLRGPTIQNIGLTKATENNGSRAALSSSRELDSSYTAIACVPPHSRRSQSSLLRPESFHFEFTHILRGFLESSWTNTGRRPCNIIHGLSSHSRAKLDGKGVP